MKFRPLHDRVLIRRLEQDAKTAGGIIIPDSAQEKPMEGEAAMYVLWMLKPVTAYCSQSGQVQKSLWTAKSCW